MTLAGIDISSDQNQILYYVKFCKDSSKDSPWLGVMVSHTFQSTHASCILSHKNHNNIFNAERHQYGH